VEPRPSDEDTVRYSRQTRLSDIGPGGQSRIGAAHAVVVGCGALGCTSADLLARAGVGRLTLIDRDQVELTNLQRQSLFDEQDAREGRPKAEAAAARLSRVNSSIQIEGLVADVRADRIERLLLPRVTGTTMLIDGTDNFETRYLLNDVSVKHRLPLVYGGVVGTGGVHAMFVPPGPCLRCMFPEPPEPGSQQTCESAGVLGPAVAIVGAMQAAAALRWMVAGRACGALVELDVWSGRQRSIALGGPVPDCPACGRRVFEFLDAPVGDDAVRLCGADAVQVWPRSAAEIDLVALAERLRPMAGVTGGATMLRVSPRELPGVLLTVFPDARAIIRGVTSPERARALYSRWVGD